MTYVKKVWRLNSTSRYFKNRFPLNIWHINVPWSGVRLLSFLFPVACPKNKQGSQSTGKLATSSLQFSVRPWVCWKHHVDQNGNYFLNSIVFGRDKLILFAWGRSEQHKLEKAYVESQNAWIPVPTAGSASSPRFLRRGRQRSLCCSHPQDGGEIRRDDVHVRVLFTS